MIKMICSDIDGTLLSYSQKELSERVLELIRQLNKRGIIFVPTSGRQIISMQRLFASVTDCCKFVCSNGGVICESDGSVIETVPIPKDTAVCIAHDFLDRTDGRGEVNMAGAQCCHLLTRGIGMEDRIRYIGNRYEVIKEPEDVDDEIVKVSCFLPDGADKYADRFTEKWKAFNCAIAGPFWIDTTLANKGTGVQRLCRRLGINLKDVVAFGDNYNDVSMLDIVGQPYIMSSGTEELKSRYTNHTDSVEDTLASILKEV